MAALVNIAGLTPVEDPSYRYKMPKIMGKVEGRGNGIKTVLVNVVEVAQALNREPPEVTKFFGCELGAQTIYSEDIDRAVVNGAHTDNDLQNKVKIYIEKFVLCPTCKLPETHYKIKDGIINQKCLACGSKGACDMGHKLTTFIIAQHKKAKAEAKKAEGAEKKKKKDKKDKDGSEKADSADKKSKKEKEVGEGSDKKKKSKDKERKTVFDAEEVEEEVDVDAEADDDKKAVEEACNRFTSWFSEESKASSSAEVILEELRSLQTMSSLRSADRAIIFIGATMTENIVAGEEIVKHKKILEALGPSAIQQRHLIAAFEWFCGAKYPSLMGKFPIILKLLYDEEIVEEDIFLMWSADYARNEYSAADSLIDIDTLEQLKENAGPFITWVKEADEEGEDSDEEEEDDEEEA